MHNSRKRCTPDEQEINSVIDRILKNDRKDEKGCHQFSNDEKKCCDAYENFESKQANCAVELSARFSLKVMEALRSLQRKDTAECENSYCVDDIVNYIENNYRHDGDLYAQVLTALPQICAQGFVVKTGIDEYHLVGPFACMINQHLKSELENCPTACTANPDDCCDDECLNDLDEITSMRKEAHGISKKANSKKSKKSTYPFRRSTAKKTNNPYTHCLQNRCDRFSTGSRRDDISKEKTKKCGNITSLENKRVIDISSNNSSEKDCSSDDSFFRALKSKKSDNSVRIINTDDKELKRWLRRCCRESKQQGTL